MRSFFVLVFFLFAIYADAGLLTPRKTLQGMRQRSCPPPVANCSPAQETTRFRRQPDCPDGSCLPRRKQPSPEPLPKFDIDFDDEAPQAATEPEPEPEVVNASVTGGGLTKLDAIMALIVSIAGAISAFIATREDDEEDKEEEQQPEVPTVTSG